MLRKLTYLLLLIASTGFAAFPTVESSTSNEDVGGVDLKIDISLPATISADAVIIACIGVDGITENPVTAESGVSRLFLEDGGYLANLACFCKDADGTEDGGTWVIDVDTQEGGSSFSYSITGTFDGTCSSVESATSENTSAQATLDPPDLNPTGWGTEDTLWIATGQPDQDWTNTHTTYPTDCTGNQFAKHGTTGSGFIMGCTRNLNAANWNPGVDTWANSNPWAAATLAVRPAASGATLLRRRR